MKGFNVLTVFGIIFCISSIRCQRWFNITDDFKDIPTINGSKADVNVQLEMSQLIANAPMMNVQMNYFMITRWFDYRFVKQNSTDPNTRWVTITGTDPDWEKIWIPDVYLVNELPQGILEASPTDSIRIYENGTVKMSKRHAITVFCKIRLLKLPMTKEICPIEFQSNSYSTDQMNLSWWNYDPVTYSPNFVSVVSEITDVETTICEDKASEDHHPCLYARLGIDQIYKGFMVQVYIPSTGIIIMLWLDFWVSLREVSARVRVVAIAFTTMIAQMVGILIVFPDTVQMEPLIVWNVVCMLFNLLAFVEFVVVHNMYINRCIKFKKDELMKKSLPPADQSSLMVSNEHPKDKAIPNGHPKSQANGLFRRNKVAPVEDSEASPLLRKPSRDPRWCTPYRVDRVCMVLYLALFLLFNMGYWLYFLL